MDREVAQRFARQLKIDMVNIVREEWELIVLRELAESPVGKILVFRGGTALRLAYSLPRFSQDLDFSSFKDISEGQFRSVINRIVDKFPQAKIDDLASKFYTHLAQIKVRETWQEVAFSVKIEISRRPDYIKDKDYELKLLSSEVTNVQALVFVATLERIFQEKQVALKRRSQPRDLFDVWFIAQKLKKDITLPKDKFSKSVLRGNLRRFLPEDYWRVIEEL